MTPSGAGQQPPTSSGSGGNGNDAGANAAHNAAQGTNAGSGANGAGSGAGMVHLAPGDVKKLMETAVHMQQEHQTQHPKYLQIITLLRQYQQHQRMQAQRASQSQAASSAAAAAAAAAAARASYAARSTTPTPIQQPQQVPYTPQMPPPRSQSMAGVPLDVASHPFMQNKPECAQPAAQQAAALQQNPSVQMLFTEKQLEYLHNQIRSFKILSQAMDQSIAKSSGAVVPTPGASVVPPAVNVTPSPIASVAPTRTPTPNLPVVTATAKSPLLDQKAVVVKQPPPQPVAPPDITERKPKWKRAARNLLYLGPECFDGDLVELEAKVMDAFGPSNSCSPWLGMNDATLKMKYMQALQSHLKATLEKMEANEAILTDADREVMRDLRCALLQQRLRNHVAQAYTKRLSLLGEPSAVDRKSFRRRRPLSRVELQSDEKEKRKRSVALEKKRRSDHQLYLKAILNHSRDFFTYHKNVKLQIAKSAKGVKAFVDQKVSKAEREEDRQEKLRLKALKANDMDAYSKLVAEAKNERLTYLLSQTNGYLDSIRKLVRQHKDKHHAADVVPQRKPRVLEDGTVAEEDDDDLDYLEIASKGELPRQPMMLVGGDLKEYQLRGLQWMVSLYDNHLNGILADEMGLGKTIQTISLLTYVTEVKHNHGPFLVVVPLSTLSNWVNEFKKWAPDLVLVVYKGPPQVRKEIFKQEMSSCQFNVLLTTYEYIMKDKHVLRKYEWQYIIVDEGHRMKNAQSKFAMTLGTMYTSRNRLLLTGTPLQNSLPELWALLNFLLPTIFESVDTFEQWFSKPFSQFSGSGESNELSDEERMLIINRLHQVLRPFLLRRVKSSVLDQLPDKVERVLKCDLSGWQKILYRRIQEGGALLMETADGDGQKKGKTKYTSKGLSNVLMQLRKVCNHPYLFQANGYPIDFDIVRSSGKFELLDRMLPKLKAAGHRVLMFSQMTQLMHVLEDYFNYRGFRYLRLDGSTSADEREQRMFMFNAADSPYFIFLLSTRAGGLGLNLATADTVIIFDSDWNPAMDAQAQDRAHRIGQKNEVRVFRLVTNTPVEERILSRATDKMNMNNLVVEAGKFNNRSKEAERRALLESLIKMESEEATNAAGGEEAVSTVLLDDEINEMMAVTEEELTLYQRLDVERIQREEAEWAEHCKRVRIPCNPRSRLMADKDVPDWLREADEKMENDQSGRREDDWNFDMDVDGSRSRKKKEISYRDKFTDSEVVKMCEDGIDEGAEESDSESKSKKALIKAEKKAVGVKRPRDEVTEIFNKSEEEHVQRQQEQIENEDDVTRKQRKVFCYFYRKIYDGVLKLADNTGRLRSQLYLEKPSALDYPDYYTIIKRPMDLATIKTRIDKHLYNSHEMFEDDFKLMVANAQLYNHPESLVYYDAIEIDKFVKSKLKRVRQRSLEQLTEDYEAARQQHKMRSKARKDKKRSRHD
ncbi:TPA: hypothetical protein N0F65_006292 [Lagenidium giganteum]|uniref:Uncharacterized protein n=1 Tax=Lagenidium giganteum TaxID=4803 RepID=A0AAV2YFL6_9STRA|nr:TPA: hypothetical protein N0F65_006292 [Lagenidium giganteum]